MRNAFPKYLVALFASAILAFSVAAQNGPPPEEAAQFAPERPNLLEGLNLTQDQIRQIRLMNKDRKPRMDAAQQRLQNATRALDAAIYSDELDESQVQARLASFQAAQAEVAGIRFQSEVELRKILTREQLVKFRQLRARAARARENFRMRRQEPPRRRPLQRIRQLPGASRVN